jgi:signal transduction histidine kinase
MTLKLKLLLSTILEIVLVVLVSLFLVSSARQSAQASENEAQASRIVDTVSQIRFATFEHLLHHNERSFEQWHAKHTQLGSLLEPANTHSQEERTVLETIRGLSGEVEPVFMYLVDSYKQTSQDAAAQKELQERLATQLLVKQQAQISLALKLAGLARDQSTLLRAQDTWLVAVVITSMLLITIANFLIITRTITKALGEFQKGAKQIADGNFAYRLAPPNRHDEFGQVGTAFNYMASNLEQIDKVKSEFILLASHQLRTPLTAVKWYSKALVGAGADAMAAERKKRYLKQVYASNERMIELVNKLLDASKIGFGSLLPAPKPVQLAVALEQVLRDISAQIRDNKIEVIKNIDDGPLVVTIDPTWLHIILQNLLSNAVRYSRPGQTIRLSVEHQKNDVLVTIADSGYGIPAGQQSKIFTKLFRADNAKKAMGEGSGLGLYITKAMVEQAGGKIWFESVENQGATFFVKLPVNNKEE